MNEDSKQVGTNVDTGGEMTPISDEVIDIDIDAHYKRTYTRFNSPFWQVVIVSFVAFG